MRFGRQKDNRAKVFRVMAIVVIVLAVVGFAAVRLTDREEGPDKLIPFAECLTAKGATFYGAYWCPHCSKQKKAFGKAFAKVTYVECAVPGNPREQTQECKDKNITGYPTWIFADGSREGGQLSFEKLSEKTGCPWGDAVVAPATPPATGSAAPDAAAGNLNVPAGN